MSLELVVPDIGDFENVEIIEILVKKGDKINKNDSVVTLESDKSSVEVPSNFEGIIENIKVKIGDKVSKGDLILTLSSSENQINKSSEKQKIDEKIPPVTEKIIQEAEGSIKKIEEKIEDKKIENEVKMITSKDDIDPVETKEWLDSLSAVLQNDGSERAHFLIKQLIDQSYKVAADANVPMCPPNSGNFLFALTTIAAAFHLMKDLILRSIF